MEMKNWIKYFIYWIITIKYEERKVEENETCSSNFCLNYFHFFPFPHREVFSHPPFTTKYFSNIFIKLYFVVFYRLSFSLMISIMCIINYTSRWFIDRSWQNDRAKAEEKKNLLLQRNKIYILFPLLCRIRKLCKSNQWTTNKREWEK